MKTCKYLLILTLFIFASLKAYSQAKETQFEIDIKNPETFKMLSDDSGNWAVYLADTRNYYFKLINSEGKVIRTKVLKRTTKDNKMYIGGMSSDKGFYMFFKDREASNPRTYSSFHISTVDTNDVHYTDGPLLQDKKEELKKAFSVGNAFYTMTINKKFNTVYFLKFKNEREFEKYSFIVSPDIIKVFENGDFRVFKENQISSILNLTSEKKLFLDSEDNFVFIKDHPEDLTGTEIVKFHLKEQKTEHLQIPALNTKSISYGRVNNWYHDGKIYKFIQGDGEIIFLIQDIATQKIIKEYSYYKGDTIGIITGQLHKEKEGAMFDKKDVVEKNKTIFKKLIAGNPFIKVVPQKSGRVSFLIGTYTESTGMIAASPASLGIIGIGAIYSAGAIAGSSVEINWFNSYLNDSSFEIENTPAPKPDIIAMEEYLANLSMTEEFHKNDIVQLKINDTIFLAYIVKKEKLVKVVKVREEN